MKAHLVTDDTDLLMDLMAENERLRGLVKAYQLENARLRELLHIADFEGLD
jgi:hypothetical protein